MSDKKDIKQKTSDKILEYIRTHKQASGAELYDFLGTISERAVRKQLKNLLEKGLLTKIGKPPKVYYRIAEESDNTEITIAKDIKSIIDERYLYISPSGKYIPGWEGFIAWCQKTNQDPVKTAKEYISTLKKYDAHKRVELINGLYKLKDTFDKVYLDKLYYLDFYSIERFGKTKLGQLLLYAKQSQDSRLMQELVEEIRPKITKILEKHKIDAVLFVPPTVKRERQLMNILEKRLKLPASSISVTKVKTPVIVPQKTLTKLKDRVANAQETIVIDEKRPHKNILIIDDAVGSGATMNEVAKQIHDKGLCSGKVIGLAITGSYKGFDVISEV